jgi:hypothetical protein
MSENSIGLEIEEDLEQSPSESSELGLEFEAQEDPMMLGTMLNEVLGNYLEYRSENGSLNLADTVLLLRNSVETQNELMSKQIDILAEIANNLKPKLKPKMNPGKK